MGQSRRTRSWFFFSLTGRASHAKIGPAQRNMKSSMIFSSTFAGLQLSLIDRLLQVENNTGDGPRRRLLIFQSQQQ
jgi:hypothetical protein